MRALLLVALLLAPTLAGCAREEAPDEVRVVATIYPVAFVAQRVAGDRLVVNALVPDGALPHGWEPRAEARAALAGADLVLRAGAGLDDWAAALANEIAPRAESLDASAAIALRRDADGGAPDPHYWLDPAQLSLVAAAIAEALARVDPEGAADYRANADALASELAALDAEWRAGLARCDRRVAIATHRAFEYAAARYGFTAVGIAGLDPTEEPTEARLAEVVEFARSRNVTVIFHERLQSPRVALKVADELEGGATLPLDPIEGVPAREREAGTDFFVLARQNLANLRAGMQCR